MLILNFFKFKNQIKDANEAARDPEGFAKSMVKQTITGYLFSFLASTVLILLGLGLLGYSSLLGGPHVFAKVLFWIILIPVILLLLTASSLYSLVKKNLGSKKTTNSINNIIDVEPE